MNLFSFKFYFKYIINNIFQYNLINTLEKSSIKEDISEITLLEVYGILSNLQVETKSFSKDDFLNNNFINLKDNKTFFKIGILPKYLNPKNFINEIKIENFLIFNPKKEKDLITTNTVLLAIKYGYIGFIISKNVEKEIKKFILESTQVNKIHIKIIINNRISEFVIFEIKCYDLTLVTTTDTLSINNDLYLDRFPFSSLYYNNKSFLNFFLFIINEIEKEKKEVLYDQLRRFKKYTILTNIPAPMFIFLRKLKEKIILDFFNLQIFLKISSKKNPLIDFCIKTNIDNINIFKETGITLIKNIESINIDNNDNNSIKEDLNSNSLINLIKITKINENNWKINIKNKKIWETDFKKNNKKSISFFINKNGLEIKKITFSFDEKILTSKNWVLRTCTIKNPVNNIKKGLEILSEIIKHRNGNIILKINEDSNKGDIFVICFDFENTNILISKKEFKISNIFYPEISELSSPKILREMLTNKIKNIEKESRDINTIIENNNISDISNTREVSVDIHNQQQDDVFNLNEIFNSEEIDNGVSKILHEKETEFPEELDNNDSILNKNSKEDNIHQLEVLILPEGIETQNSIEGQIQRKDDKPIRETESNNIDHQNLRKSKRII